MPKSKKEVKKKSKEKSTQLRRAQKVLKKSEEKYRSILQDIEELYYEVDLAGNLSISNDSMANILGYSKDELIGINNRQYMDQETAKKVFQTFNEVYRTGLPAKAFDWKLIRKDGEKRILETSVALLRDIRGQPVGFYGIGRDITDRKRAEEALRGSEEKYRTILQSIEEFYYQVDLAGNMVFFNDAMVKISGYSKEELMGMNYRKYVSERSAQNVYQTFNEVYRTGIPAKALDWEVIRKDGAKRFLETSVSLLRDSTGQSIGFYGIGRDVTERKQAEEQARFHEQQLMQASKMVALGTLVSGVAHEINNPNNFIMLNAPLLLETWENARPILEEYYEKNGEFLIGGMNFTEMRENIPSLFSGILEGSKRIKQIVEDLRNFARRDASEMTQSVDVNAVLKSAVTLLSNMIMKSTNHFSGHYDTGLPLVKGNFQRLEQVIINLIQNACQALRSPQKGISVSTGYDQKAKAIFVRVEDEGVGIPSETLPHITDSFFTTKPESGGTGLGLSISSKIVKEHGGTLTFASEVNKGTRAEVLLPVSQKKRFD